MHAKFFNLTKEVGITIKCKKSSQLCSSNQLGILNYVTIIHQPVIASSSMHVQSNACTSKAFLAHYYYFYY